MSPGTLDVGLERRDLRALDEAVTNLRRHTGRPVEALRGDLDERWAIEHGLQLLCAQDAVDIATHLAAASGHEVPDYRTAIDLLATLGVAPPAFVQRFRGVAGFRNLMAHGYLALDPDRLQALLDERLDAFVELVGYVEKYLAS